jgi:hypothetical protein
MISALIAYRLILMLTVLYLYSGVLYGNFTGAHPVATRWDLSSGATTAISIRKVKRGDANV